MNGIGFGMKDKFDIVKSGQPFDMVFTIEENEWNGTVTLQLQVKDIR
jgi:single-stranded-DNA-specific exonuclease